MAASLLRRAVGPQSRCCLASVRRTRPRLWHRKPRFKTRGAQPRPPPPQTGGPRCPRVAGFEKNGQAWPVSPSLFNVPPGHPLGGEPSAPCELDTALPGAEPTPAARSGCCRPCVPCSAAAAAPCTWAPRAARGRTSRRWVASRRRLLLGASERFPSLSSVFLGSVGFPGRAKSSQAAGLPGVFGVFFKAPFQGLCVFPHSNACGGLRFCPPVRSGVGGSSVYLLPRDREAAPAACHMLVVLGSFSGGGGVAINAKRVFPPNSQVQPTPPTGGLGGGASESAPRPFRPAT